MTWQPPPDDASEPNRPDAGLGPPPPERPSGEPTPPSPTPPEATPPQEPQHPVEPPAQEPPPPGAQPSPWQNPPAPGQPPSDPYGHPQFAQPQYPQYGYGQQPAGYPPYQAYPPPKGTNVLAIVALIVSIVILPPLGAILGHVSRRQIRSSGEGGDGVAVAAIIIGWTLTGLGILIVVCIAVIVGISTPNATY